MAVSVTILHLRGLCSLLLTLFSAFVAYTSEVYEAFAKSKGFSPQTVDIGDGTIGCWIGDKHADTVLLWFHGTLWLIKSL